MKTKNLERRSFGSKMVLAVLLSVGALWTALAKQDLRGSTDIVSHIKQEGIMQDKLCPQIQFEKVVVNIHNVVEGDMVEAVYAFKNIGNAPLVIQHVEKPCSCTTPVWPEEPIMPGKEGKIVMQFNSDGKAGLNRKSAMVKTNSCTNGEVNLLLKVDVMTKKAAKKAKRDK